MKVLLTGATGFVGTHLYPALVAAGHEVVCATRSPDEARARDPDRRWVELDLDAKTIDPAFAGCDAAYFLIHGMDDGADYPEREARGARAFRAAAARAGLERVVFLGGVMPAHHQASRHLESRQRTGEVLRGGEVETIELRAGMIIGPRSAGWDMVRDLAARLPAMLLPRWLRNHSHPVAIDDVVAALVAVLGLPARGSRVFELPGPERIAHRELLRRVAGELGHSRLMLDVPVLTPRLSSYWIALVTRVDLRMARELVEGVRFDLDPSGPILWDVIGHHPMPIDDAVRLALADEKHELSPSPDAVERARAVGRRFARAIT